MQKSPTVFLIRYFEFWEKSLGFLQFDWAGIVLSAEGKFYIEFMTMYGEIYHHLSAEKLESARVKLTRYGFQKFEPTPERLHFRHPFQLGAFHIGDPQPRRIHLKRG